MFVTNLIGMIAEVDQSKPEKERRRGTIVLIDSCKRNYESTYSVPNKVIVYLKHNEHIIGPFPIEDIKLP